MSKQEEAGLILKLYELRREDTMRKARDWYFREFNPQSMADFTNAMFGEHSGHLRMVASYWDMAAALSTTELSVCSSSMTAMENTSASSRNSNCCSAKSEPSIVPKFAANLEKLIDATPDGRKRTAGAREQMKAMRAQLEARQAKAA